MKIRKLLFIMAVPLTMSGCTYQEVYEKAYLRGMSVSGEDVKTVSMNFYNENSSPTKTKNQNFNDILKDSEVISGKSIFTGHTEVIVLGDCDYTETLRFMLEEWKVSPSCLVVYGGESSADIIENSDSGQLADVIRTAVKQNKIPQNDIITILSSLLKDNQTEIPLITPDGRLESTVIFSS